MMQLTFQSVVNTTTAPVAQIGSQGQTPDGREWAYVKVGSGGLAKGSVAVPDAVTAVDTVSSSTDAQGRIVYITEANAGWTVGAFADCWVIVDDGTGVGQAGRIMTNTTDTLQLYPEFAFSTALSVSDSDITITKNYQVVKAAITSKKQNAVGIAQIAMSANDYGWILTKGEGVVLAGAQLTPTGSNFTTGDDTTGQVILGVTSEGPFDAQSLGRVLVVNAAADQLTQVWVEI
jgi:hypothetical protein